MLQVIGWFVSDAVLGSDPEPVFIESPTSTDLVVFETPDGKFIEPSYATYSSMEEVVGAALKRHQERWDRENPLP